MEFRNGELNKSHFPPMKARYAFFLFTLLILFAIPIECAHRYPDFCIQHGTEIGRIRSDALGSILEANRNGGQLINSCGLASQSLYFENRLRSEITYSDFKRVFEEYILICAQSGMPSLCKGLQSVSDTFLDLYSNCIKKHDSVYSYFERGRIYFDRGLFENSLLDILEVIRLNPSAKYRIPLEDNQYLSMFGQTYAEAGMYTEAIDILSKLLARDPANRDAYYNRALAYFELGAFDQAITDYMTSGKRLPEVDLKGVTHKFEEALIAGLISGCMDSVENFVPSLCYSAYGIGTAMWAFVQQPTESTRVFCGVCQEATAAAIEYLSNLNSEQFQECAEEMRILFDKFQALDEQEKGFLIGSCIGKYGVDIFACGGTVKALSAFNRLKNANRICNLEALAHSKAGKTTLKEIAVRHATVREDYFKNVPIHWDRQNKHVVGAHNYEKGKSIVTHQDPEYLLQSFAGTGTPIRGLAGHADYQEVVNFGQKIGINIDPITKVGTETSWGKIHYSKKGAHIVPTHPRIKD